MQIHIGKKIEERMKELRFSPTFLAKRVNTSRQNIYGIFKRKSIDTDLLKKISEVLEYDFFSYYRVKIVEQDRRNRETEDINHELEMLRKDLEELKKQFKKFCKTKK